MSDETVYLVCGRADAPMTVSGSSFKFHCSHCGRRVMIAPSGLQVLRERPGIFILCLVCFRGLDKVEVEQLTAKQRMELKQPSIPNLWKERN